MAVTDFIDDEKPLYVETDNELYIRNFLDQADGDCRYISGGIYCLRRPALGVLNNAISRECRECAIINGSSSPRG